jgi:antitoxin PrlF
MPEATITSKGQITIAVDIRRSLGVQAQDRLSFTPMSDGTVVLRAKKKTLADLKGLLSTTELDFQEEAAVEQALWHFRSAGAPDFADGLHVALSASAGRGPLLTVDNVPFAKSVY